MKEHIVGETYGCLKCGYVVEFMNERQFSMEESKHSVGGCLGKLEEAKGDCLRIAVKNSKKHDWLLCMGRVKGKLFGQSYLHAWNEAAGHLEAQGSKIMIKTDSGPDVYVLDFSESSKILSEQAIYYEKRGIIKDTIRRFKKK